MLRKQFKRGIAMVELIFALVIMGIALMSAPMLIHQSIQRSNIALQQESIASLASHTGILLTKYWDEGDANLSNGVAPIITLSNPVGMAPPIPPIPPVPPLPPMPPFATPFGFAGIENNVTGRTVTVSDANVVASVLGHDSGINDFNDIDDYNGHDVNLTIFNNENSTVGALGDYIDVDINISTQVTFVSDRLPVGNNFGIITNVGNMIFDSLPGGVTPFPVGNDSNIKFIQTTLTSNSPALELQKNIVLRAFSCNLGTYSLGGKQYQ